MTRVLFVDDDNDFLALVRKFLGREDPTIDLVTSASAINALQLLEKESYDVVVADYLMPEMNGLELLEHLRTSGNPIPFIVFTGRGREEIAIRALNLGANHYLKKGGELKSLFAELAHFIKRTIADNGAGMGSPIRGNSWGSAGSAADFTAIVDSLARVIANIESQMTALKNDIAAEVKDLSNSLRQEFSEPIYSIEKKINQVSNDLGRLNADLRSWLLESRQEIPTDLPVSSVDLPQEFLDRLSLVEKEIKDVSSETSALIDTPDGSGDIIKEDEPSKSVKPIAAKKKAAEIASERKIPSSLLIGTIRRCRELKKTVNELMTVLQWRNRSPTEAMSTDDIMRELNNTKEIAQGIAKEKSVSAGLRKHAQELIKVITEIEKGVVKSKQKEFLAPEIREILKPKSRYIEQLISQLDSM
ncbi:MAG: response regulator [Candidatus Heimdallarchaeota archaeon]